MTQEGHMTLQTLLLLIAVVAVIASLAYFTRKSRDTGAEDGKDQWVTSAYPDSKPATETAQRIVVTDIQMPFESMVIFMNKWALASIPAAVILGLLLGAVFAMFGSLHS